MSTCCICDAELSRINPTPVCLECRILARAGWFGSEVWCPVVGFTGWEISNQGRIRSARTHAIREPDRSGVYPRVCLNGKQRRVHTLMAATWLGPKPWGARLIRHLDDNPDNASIENLAWGDHAENAEDAKRNGRIRLPEQDQ